MKFMGSKSRIAKHILPIMLQHRQGRTWVEPFVGGGNMIDKVDGDRIGSDIDPYVVSALKSIRDCIDELPRDKTEFLETHYNALRESDLYKHKGYAGFAFSYGGKWMGGWRRDGAGKRDYVKEAYLNAKAQSGKLLGVDLVRSEYAALRIPENSLIYCDPPYRGATGYRSTFDHDLFWDWCRKMASEGHIVFVSEYTAPPDFECVWAKEITSSLTKDTGSKKAIERLFKAPNISMERQPRGTIGSAIAEKADAIMRTVTGEEVSVTKTAIELYKVRTKLSTWAEISVDAGNNHGRISIASAFGNWSYFWGSCGDGFKKFLIGLDIHYVAGKFGEDRWFDHEATMKALRKFVAAEVEGDEEDKDAMEEIQRELDELEDYTDQTAWVNQAYHSPQLRKLWDTGPDVCTDISPMFRRFWTELWKPFTEHLRAETAK